MNRNLFWAKLIVILFALLAAQCNLRENCNGDNPVPTLSSISPISKAVHMPPFTLTVNGSNFVSGTKIVFNGTEQTTQFINDAQLSCTIATSDLSALASFDSQSDSASDLASGSVPVWVSNPMPGGGDSSRIYFNITDNHSFTDADQIPGTPGSASNPAIAVDADGNLSVVFESYDSDSDSYAISFMRSTDFGATWSTPVNIVDSGQECLNPDIDIDTNGYLSVSMALYDLQIYYTRSTDNGATWSVPLSLSDGTDVNDEAGQSLESALAVDDSGGINVIWTQRNTDWFGRVYFTRSVDDGATFSTPMNIFAAYDYHFSTDSPAIAVDNAGGIYAGWDAWPGGRYGWAFFNYSHDNGTTWSLIDTEFPVSTSLALAIDPDGNVNITYSDSYIPYTNQILFRKSIDRGINFESPIDVTANGSDYMPHMTIDGAGNINIIYLSGNDFFFKRSIDGGTTWSSALQVTNNTATLDAGLDEEGNIYIVFEEYGTGELFFTRTSF